jgi:hypothetical protein
MVQELEDEKERVEELYRESTLFNSIDKDRDGSVSKAELVHALVSGMEVEEDVAEAKVGRLMEVLDFDDDGCLRYALGSFDAQIMANCMQTLSPCYQCGGAAPLYGYTQRQAGQPYRRAEQGCGRGEESRDRRRDRKVAVHRPRLYGIPQRMPSGATSPRASGRPAV